MRKKQVAMKIFEYSIFFAFMYGVIQLAIMWAGVFVSSLLAEKTRLTSVLYFLAFGAIMVNVGILPEDTAPVIRGFAEIGIILIMFALGFEENTRNFLSSIKRSWGIAFFGALAPFFTAYSVAEYFWDDTNVSIMCGLTMTATAVSLTLVSLKNLGLGRSKVAALMKCSKPDAAFARISQKSSTVVFVTVRLLPDQGFVCGSTDSTVNSFR